MPITDLAVKEHDLVAATQGRSYWILDDLTVLHQMTEEIAATAGSHLFTPQPTYAISLAGGFFGPPPNSGENPPDGVVLYYLLGDSPPPETTFELEILEADGDPIWTFTRKPEKEPEERDRSSGPDTALLEAEVGLNRFVWDLTYPPMERFPGLVLWNDMRRGPKAVPGSYRARLIVGESSSEVPIEIVADPRVAASREDLEAQFDFVITVRDKLSEIHRELGRVKQVREQLDRLETRIAGRDGVEEITAAIAAIREALEAPEEALYQTKNRSRQDPLNFPIRLNDKLAGVMQTAAMGDARPTESARAVRDALVARADARLGEIRAVWKTELPALNRLVLEKEIEAIHLEE